MKTTRRLLLQTAAAAPVMAAKPASKGSSAAVYERLGVKPIINGMGTVTVLGGSLMPPEVIQAMDDAAKHFVHLPELQKKAGAHLAKILNVPAAMVTGGAAASISVGTIACLSRGDKKRLQALPETAGGPRDVVMQRTHRSGYEHQMTMAGANVVTIETAEELRRAIGAQTAMLFYMNKAEKEGKIQRAEFVRIAKERGVPTFNDAAADVPPKENLWNYVNRDGFDLVAFSGGKGLQGPQSAGLLLGRKDLIEAATEGQSPYGGIGRGMKVGKEEIAGMIAAVERFLRIDHEAEAREMERRVAEMTKLIGEVPGVKMTRFVPEIANAVPHLTLEFDAPGRVSAKQIHDKLLEGSPAIYTLLRGPRTLTVSVWMMSGAEHRTTGKRLAELLRA
ncbi:MAG: selenocysteine synthase [Bryobacterales bacterium]|nr:selenocysteine synthase [Bryobacterales bacterium]